MFKRVFLVILDSVGIGEADDAAKFDDVGSNTLLHTIGEKYNLNVLEKMGLTNLIGKEVDGIRGIYAKAKGNQ